MRKLVALKRIVGDALGHFSQDDGWALASHVALSTLMAMFPFLIFATALAGFLGAETFADSAMHLIFDTWPAAIAEPLAHEVANVLTVQRGDLLTIGVLLAFFFASSGVEALRTSLNRAYRQIETRSAIVLRLQSLGFVLLATVTLVVTSLLLVAVPVALGILQRRFPAMAAIAVDLNQWRLLVAALVLITGLVFSHLWLPSGHRRILDILPGVGLTLIAWMAGSAVFATYLDNFANYASTYAGLASIMVAIIFLYIVSAIFIIGGELNAAIMRFRSLRANVRGASR